MNLNKDFAKHIDKMAGIVEELENIRMRLDTTLTVGILVASVNIVEHAPFAAAIKKLAKSEVKWESAAGRLIEE